MDHLAEVQDWATKNAIDTAQGHFERLLLQLLPDDDQAALAFLEDARSRVLHEIKTANGSDFIAQDQQARSARIAVAIMKRTFERLIGAVRG
jgi:hypothetical protein